MLRVSQNLWFPHGKQQLLFGYVSTILQDLFLHLQLPGGTSFYGTGEVSGQLERTGKRVISISWHSFLCVLVGLLYLEVLTYSVRIRYLPGTQMLGGMGPVQRRYTSHIPGFWLFCQMGRH